MTYKFECSKCKEQEEKTIMMSEYDTEKDKQTCSKCGGKMTRIIENFLGATLCNGMYGIDRGKGWNT